MELIADQMPDFDGTNGSVDLNNNELDKNANYSAKVSEIVWRNVIIFIVLHVLAIWGLWLYAVGELKWQTVIVGYICGYFSAIGITAGAHRLWSHRSYKAKLPLRYILK